VNRLTRQVGKTGQAELAHGHALGVRRPNRKRTEQFRRLGWAILVATFGILAILVLEFRSFRGTFIVASVIPLGFIGGLVGLGWPVTRSRLRP